MVNHISDNHSNPWVNGITRFHPVTKRSRFALRMASAAIAWTSRSSATLRVAKPELGRRGVESLGNYDKHIRTNWGMVSTTHNYGKYIKYKNTSAISQHIITKSHTWHNKKCQKTHGPGTPKKAPPHTRLDSCCGFISRTRTPRNPGSPDHRLPALPNRNRGFVVTHFTIKNEGLVSPLNIYGDFIWSNRI